MINFLLLREINSMLKFIIVQGENMDYRIVQKEAFHFVGVNKRVSMQFEGVNNEIVELVQGITNGKNFMNFKILNHMK